MPELWTNNAKSTLASGISSGATSLTVQSGHGARFPNPTGGDFFYCTLDDGTNVEIVQVTARSTDVFTVTRAQQGTSAAAFLAGDRVELRLTAAALDSFVLENGSTLAQNIALTGDISPTQIASDQNDYNPTGLSTAAVLRLDSDAARSITGLAGGADGRSILILNIGSFDITLVRESASSTAANRFTYTTTHSAVVSPNEGVFVWYDSTSSRWRVVESGSALRAPLDFALAKANTPGTITADQDNWAAGSSTGTVLRIEADAARNITGLSGGVVGRVLILHNIGSFNITLKDESVSSTAANRFALSADLTLGTDQSCILQYDSTSSRWRLAASSAPSGAPAAHASTHNAGGGDALAIDAAAGTGSFRTLGTGAQQACAGNDSRLSDSRTPTAHATSHKNGGSDEVATATAAANAIPKAGAGGTLNIGWIPTGTSSTTVCIGNDSRLSDSRTPTAHATSHKSGGSDSIKLDELAAPTDVTTLNASTSAHGLLKKLSNVSTEFLNGQGNFAALAVGDLATASRTRQFTWVVSSPAVGGVFGPRVPWACTITRLGSYTNTGTVTFNIEDRTSIGSAGTNILSSDQVSDTTGEETTASFNKSTMAAGEYLYVDISAVASSPGQVVIWLEVVV